MLSSMSNEMEKASDTLTFIGHCPRNPMAIRNET